MKIFLVTLSACLLFMGMRTGLPINDRSDIIPTNNTTQDSLMIRQLFDQALANGESYKNLEYLCKVIGHRLSGSKQADEAITWGKSVLDKMPLDRVVLQQINIPFWERGDKEWAAISEEYDIDLSISTLGGSVGTDGLLQAEVIEVHNFEELEARKDEVKGKIVFYNRPMDPRLISTFESYGGCVNQRYWGAVEAASYGAVAVLVRSMTLLEHDPHPHTGSMAYKEGVQKIPSAAVSTLDANMLHTYIENNGSVLITMNLNPVTHTNVTSYNVLAEIKGKTHPEKVIVVGGHLDSWDVGQGAHDDGAGIVHSMEVLRIFKAVGYEPNYTIRVVLFMNEENGNMGGRSYADIAKKNNENHLVAIESDRGGFSPRGFSMVADSSQIAFVQSFRTLLEPYGLHYFEPGYGGV
ncbi:MAG: carboxypeptidase Q, partial [Bacteroidia bacterium]